MKGVFRQICGDFFGKTISFVKKASKICRNPLSATKFSKNSIVSEKKFYLQNFLRKSFIIALLVFALFTPMQSIRAQNPFPDLLPTGREEILRLVSTNIIKGYEDGTFRPMQNVTRAEAVLMIIRALNLDDAKRPTKFADVPAGHFASGAIAVAAEKGIVTGYTDGLFYPNKPITRAEMAVILTRAFAFPDTTKRFFEDVYVTTFGVLEINKLAASGITIGYGDGTFRPAQSITRHEFSLFLARTLYSEFRFETLAPISGNVIKAKVVNAPSGLLVRNQPSQNGQVLGALTNGTVIEYFAKIGQWGAIDYNGELGFVSLSYVQPLGVLQGKIIVVDPGHGGSDPGAINHRYGYYEKNIVLSVGLKLKQKLEQEGAKVIMTRSSDVYVSLSERSALANAKGAHAFVSIHANAATSASAHGTETYWNRTYASAASKRLADNIQKQLIARLDTYNRGVKEANFHVIRATKMPSVLVELGFITNDQEARRLVSDSFQNQAAEAIYQGLVEFFANE